MWIQYIDQKEYFHYTLYWLAHIYNIEFVSENHIRTLTIGINYYTQGSDMKLKGFLESP